MMISSQERAALVGPYRTKRDKPREDISIPGVMENPAPPWVPALVDGLGRRVPAIAIHYALAWCDEGEPVHRAEQILTLARIWPGQNFVFVLVSFLEDARKSQAGRAKSATKMKHFDAARLDREYPTYGRAKVEQAELLESLVEASKAHEEADRGHDGSAIGAALLGLVKAARELRLFADRERGR